MSIIMDGLKAVGDFIGIGSEPESIREEYIQPERLTQPAPEVMDVETENYDELDEFDFNLMDGRQAPEEFDAWEGEEFNLANETEMEANARLQEEMYGESAKGFEDDTIGVKVTEMEARKGHLSDVMEMENGGELGLISSATEERFMPIDSIEGTGPDPGMSKKEIGYGIKIPKEWYSKDKKKWPKIEGVSVDISKGITKEQAIAMSEDILKESYDTASKKVKGWSDMAEMEKSFWADLTYNGGNKAIDKNPKAKAAVDAGRTVEGMVLALDFIKAGGKPLRGLLNRRLTRYNQAALEITGAPVVEEYVFGPEIKIKFSSPFMTDKVSNKFAEKIEKNGGWLTISRGGDKGGGTFEAGNNFKYER